LKVTILQQENLIKREKTWTSKHLISVLVKDVVWLSQELI
jgi:hypothetical protein